VQAARDAFFAEQLKDVLLENIVVLDESFATTIFTRLLMRCLRNRRLYERVPAGHWKRLTILAAITVRGVIAGATTDAATDADIFGTFINDCLTPALRPDMIVVMDNLSSHKVVGVREAVEAAGCRVIYLPPYSPDLSPIENVWAKTKSIVRDLSPRTVPDVEAAVTLALEAVTPTDCRHCFAACGYTL